MANWRKILTDQDDVAADKVQPGILSAGSFGITGVLSVDEITPYTTGTAILVHGVQFQDGAIGLANKLVSAITGTAAMDISSPAVISNLNADMCDGVHFGSQNPNVVLAGPAAAPAADPTFRALVADDLPSRSQNIPHTLTVTLWTGGYPTFPDEDDSNRIIVYVSIPATWDGSSDITIKTLWRAASTGLVDLETLIAYATEVDENTEVILSTWTNTNLTWSSAPTYKVLTTTISSGDVVAGRHYQVHYRRNTGDANSGIVSLRAVEVRTNLQ